MHDALRIRAARPDDRAFILSLLPRLAAVPLPKGRTRREALAATRTAIIAALDAPSRTHHFFIAEDARSGALGFLHLVSSRDFFSDKRSCHISELAVAAGHDGHGVGRALLAFAQTWARNHDCAWLSLAVFPGNARARALYERAGFAPELIRMAKPLPPRARRRT